MTQHSAAGCSTPRIYAALLALALVTGAPARATAEDARRVVRVEVFGNAKTSDETVKLIAGVEPGDGFRLEDLDRIRTDLQSSGLFSEVSVFFTDVKGGVVLTITARDKHSWVIAPTFYTQPGNIGGGLGFGENNLFGENKKLLLYAQYATQDSMFLGGYLDPSIAGSRFYWRIDTFLRHANLTEFNSPSDFLGQPAPLRRSTMNYLNGGLLTGVNLLREVALDARVRGAWVYFSDAHYVEGADTTGQPMPAEPPGDDGWDVSAELQLTRDKRASWNGVTEGTMWRLSFEHALPQLGSDFDYWIAAFRTIVATRVFDTHNFVVKGSAGVGNRLPFQQEVTAGGTNLRGYKNLQFRGDTKLSASAEYSLHLFWIKSLAFRALGFWDGAYTGYTRDPSPARRYLEGQRDNKLARFRNGVGAGFRVYARSIVLPLLGIDVGYGLEARDYHVYFAVGLTEL